MKKTVLVFTLLCVTSLSFCGISGVSYFHFSEDGFGLSRAYFTYKNEISDELSFKFQTDVGSQSDDSNDDTQDDRLMVYLKKAQLDWAVSDNIKVSMGLIGMNMFNVQEATWKNRLISKSALDAAGWSSAADLGIGFYRKFGNFSTSLLMTNGEGYNHTNVDGKQKISFQALYGEKRLDKNIGYNIGLVYSTLDADPGNLVKVKGVFGGWSNGTLVTGTEYYTQLNGSSEATLMSLSVNYILVKD